MFFLRCFGGVSLGACIPFKKNPPPPLFWVSWEKEKNGSKSLCLTKAQGHELLLG